MFGIWLSIVAESFVSSVRNPFFFDNLSPSPQDIIALCRGEDKAINPLNLYSGLYGIRMLISL